MKIDLDTEHLMSCLRLWRESVDIKIPMADEFKLHYMQERPTILKNYERTAAAWLMALRTAKPEPEAQAEFDALIGEIEEFQNWAAAELQALTRVALQEEIATGLDAILARDPELAARIQALERRKKGSE